MRQYSNPAECLASTQRPIDRSRVIAKSCRTIHHRRPWSGPVPRSKIDRCLRAKWRQWRRRLRKVGVIRVQCCLRAACSPPAVVGEKSIRSSVVWRLVSSEGGPISLMGFVDLSDGRSVAKHAWLPHPARKLGYSGIRALALFLQAQTPPVAARRQSQAGGLVHRQRSLSRDGILPTAQTNGTVSVVYWVRLSLVDSLLMANLIPIATNSIICSLTEFDDVLLLLWMIRWKAIDFRGRAR